MSAEHGQQPGEAEFHFVVAEPDQPADAVDACADQAGIAQHPTDWQARSGVAHRKLFPEITPHLDGAGVIDAVGNGVDPRRVGQRVWLFMAAAGRPTGTAAEYTVVPADQAVPLPDETGFDVGASLGVPALTAHRALTVAEDGPDRLRPGVLDGKVVLAAGGGGAVGHAVIQLARWAGATVISTVSGPEKAKLAAAPGAGARRSRRGRRRRDP